MTITDGRSPVTVDAARWPDVARVPGGPLNTLSARVASGLLRRAETGYVRSYALSMLVGTVAVAGLIWVVGR